MVRCVVVVVGGGEGRGGRRVMGVSWVFFFFHPHLLFL